MCPTSSSWTDNRHSTPPPGRTPAGKPAIRILVVDDEEGIRQLLQQVLELEGYSVLMAQDGAEALQLCETSSLTVHLLLTDVVMPGMSGPELAQELRLRWPRLKVLYMSGYADDVAARDDLESGGADVIEKPFTLRDFLAKLRETLQPS